LLIGTYKHGFGAYDEMRNDPELSFCNHIDKMQIQEEERKEADDNQEENAEVRMDIILRLILYLRRTLKNLLMKNLTPKIQLQKNLLLKNLLQIKWRSMTTIEFKIQLMMRMKRHLLLLIQVVHNKMQM
jgi:hypothetical protein